VHFTAALTSPVPAVRWVALCAWQADATHELPPAAVELAGDPNPQLRSAALLALASHHHPEALERLRRGLRDTELTVRVSTVQALGLLGTVDARAILERLQDDSAEVIRAASATALT